VSPSITRLLGYTPEEFLAVGNGSLLTPPSSAPYWRGVAYGGGVFVAVSPSNVAATSPDGITWTQRTLPSTQTWQAVAYGDGTFVVVSEGDVAATSP
jgi:hypothetical protein